MSFNQHHSGSGNNIMNFGQKFVLTDDVKQQVLAAVRDKSQVTLTSVYDFAMGDELAQFLAENGVHLRRHDRIGMLVRMPPHRKPLEVGLGDDIANITLDPS